MNFKPFGAAVAQRFAQISQHELYTVGDHVTADELYAHYLASFPEGTNPKFRVNTEHDCSCCRNFIKNLGRVVAIVDGGIQTVWGIDKSPDLDPAYLAVADAMSEFVRSRPITGVFRTKERSYGAEVTPQRLEDGSKIDWNHFHGKVANRHLSDKPDEVRGTIATTAAVFRRGLEELTADALDQVLGLIEAKALYRGEEHLPAVSAFRVFHAAYQSLGADLRTLLVWQCATDPATRFRNTVIGTLVDDISKGVDLEAAVKSFESKVAPTNYKRTTALITPRMVEDAMKTIRELDLEPALQRRFARLSDVSVNNVLWVDNSVAPQMKDGVEGLLMDAVVKPAQEVDEKNAIQIGIDEFMQTVVPGAKGMEVFVASAMQPNFMSITAPVQPDTGKLLAWNNDFAWSYDGNVTDSIKEKVKRAGGNVTSAKLRVSLAWFNYDDLDIHVHEPGGNHIYFGNKNGKLDVDMNAGGGRSRQPVENVSWTLVRDGVYKVHVHQYNRRETTDIGFQLEVESEGKLQQFSYTLGVAGTVEALKLTVRNGVVVDVEVGKDLVGGGVSVHKWGIDTEKFVKVNTLMQSPNHWDDNRVGNKHWFFILDGCLNDLPARGIYNEYLNPELTKHRKVFEVLGNKTKCQPTADQLSGLGFSSTRGDEVLVRVTGAKKQQIFNVKF